MDHSTIVIRGAREHNLRGVDLDLPRDRLIVFTGVSGSGKSSLAFDTLYAEGQRRYVESLSSYARQFLGQLAKPDVDYLGGLSPSISIQQKTAGRNPRSTVGTITEIYDYLRVLCARIGQGHCPECGKPITAQTREQIIARIQVLPADKRFLVLAPVVRGQKGEFKDLFEDMLKRGFIRARVDGKVVRLTDDLKLDRRIKHFIEIVVDRLKNEPSIRPRLAEAVDQALALGGGSLVVAIDENKETAETKGQRPKAKGRQAEDTKTQNETQVQTQDLLLSAHYACTHCDRSYEPPSPQLFSFNSPQGMCLECDGLGTRFTFDPDLLVPDPALSFFDGAIPIVGRMRGMGRWRKHIFEGVAQTLGIDLRKPWGDLPAEHRQLLLYGAGDRHITYEWKQRGGGVWKHGGKWEGIVPQLLSSFKKTAAGPRRLQLEKYMRSVLCPTCRGRRLNAQASAVRVGGKTLLEICALPVGDLAAWLDPHSGPLESSLDPIQRVIAKEVLKEIRGRIGFLMNVGLHYLTLDRGAPTLSGGEAQRIRLAGQIGCGLVGVLYILDEPSIGLHPRDNERLLHSLQQLRDLGNTVIVVEHDEDTMRAADFIVDFGPGPGVRGGQVVAAGPLPLLVKHSGSVTGQYLSGKKQICVPQQRRPNTGKSLRIHGARHHNLKNIDVDIPLSLFVCVTGVSGSGKSSLINDILLETLSAKRSDVNDDGDETAHVQAADVAGRCRKIAGVEHIDKVIDIDQSPIGRTPRSNPATYIKVFDEIRQLFAQLPEAKIRGYQPGRFSFNRPGGRCEACEGNGSNRLEMDFLADVWVTCPVCEGRRFNRETLQVRFKAKNIHEVLEMDVQEAFDHFVNVPRVHAMLKTLHDVGLDYIKLGQPSPTLSGGEAQRIKLARELCRNSTGKTLYILDEPTTGLHFEDIQKLLEVLHGFVNSGNTVLVIEHNLDVVKTADWIVDLGPDGGAGGGEVVGLGTPEALAANSRSYTGQALKPVLERTTGSVNKKKTASPLTTHRSPLTTHHSSPTTHLTVQGAQQHNLKNLNVSMPRECTTVCCGPSGSGKSSLALDTIYAEGQRRYIESLSAYARQFLGKMEKPKVEHVSGLSPAISIEQKTTSKSPRSTVGTVTEVYDYLRILYARLGHPYCPQCQIPIGTQTADEIINKIVAWPEGAKLYIMAPVERKGQEKYETLWDEIRRSGFVRLRVDRRSYNVEEPPAIDHRRKHQVEVVIDRIVVRSSQRSRIADAVEAGLDLGRGVLHVAHVEDGKEEPEWKVERFSQHFACDQCGRSFEPLNPHHFSFNSPLGWCPGCEGLGVQLGANPALLIRDPHKSLREGALAAWPAPEYGTPFLAFADAIARAGGFSLDTPFGQLDPTHQRLILHGTGETWIGLEETRPPKGRGRDSQGAPAVVRFQYKGLFPAIDEASRVSFVYRQKLDHLVSEVPCPTCSGSRLRSDAAACRFEGKTIGQMCAVPLGETLAWFDALPLTKEQRKVAGELLREIRGRLQFLVDVGLDYLTLDRAAPTLSGGESQRIRLASQIGSGLTGVLYVLDEPTIGLHPRDNRRLLKALNHLRDLGNTLVMVEHDREMIAAADYLLDFGPGAGDRGGEITAQGTPKQVMRSAQSLTGKYLSGKCAIVVPTNRRLSHRSVPLTSAALHASEGERSRNGGRRRSPLSLEGERGGSEGDARRRSPLSPEGEGGGGEGNARRRSPLSPEGERGGGEGAGPALLVKGARHHNLKNIDVRFPLSAFIAVTGVSGSGKSSLVNDILHNTLARKLHRARTAATAHDDILGIEHIDKVINVDQDPIGNSPTSNPATYTGVFDLIRQLFAQLPESKVRGYHPRRFSFNKPGGRCEACEGNGQKKIEMHFLPDVWIECDVCNGRRYNPETLAVRYKGKSIADVLNLRVGEALALFINIPKIRRVLQTLVDVGLDYLSLGQAAPTLSGGEAQRVKLAAELARPNTGRTVYLLDEPTTGLHFDDLRKLLDVLNRLVDLGNTVIVVEHNMDVIKTADWVIDLGPEAGEAGGRIVAEGTPEGIVAEHTGPARSKLSFVSHTAAILAEVLAAGPHAERPRFDPSKHDAGLAGDVDLDAVGKDAKMPWEADGRRWHIADRVTTKGAAARWDGEILSWLDESIHALGDFGDTQWNHRTQVEIAAPTKSRGWFLHASTGSEWLLGLTFRVGRNTFKETDLVRRLGIKPLNDTPDLEVYGNYERVRASNVKGPWQAVLILAHKIAEIDTPAFREFLRQAVASFQQNLKRMETKPEDLMPWKINGERWHLGDKGFRPGQKVQWDRALLPRLLDLVRALVPDVDVDWKTSRDSIALRLPGINRSWGHWRTKQNDALNLRFLGKKGQFNLSQLEQVCVEPEILQNRAYGDVICLNFRTADDFKAPKIKELLAEQLRGFQEAFAKATLGA